LRGGRTVKDFLVEYKDGRPSEVVKARSWEAIQKRIKPEEYKSIEELNP